MESNQEQSSIRWWTVAKFLGLIALTTSATAVGVERQARITWLVGSLTTASLLYLANRAYRVWIETRPGEFIWREETGLVAGLAGIWLAAYMLKWSSARSSSTQATFGVGMILLSLVPVANAVGKDVSERANSGVMSSRLFRLSLNAFVVAIAVVPALHIVGVRWLVCLGVAFMWWLAGVIDRSSSFGWWKLVAVTSGAAAVVIVAVLRLLNVSSLSQTQAAVVILGLIVAFGVAVDCISARARRNRQSWKRRLMARKWCPRLAGVIGLASLVWMFVALGGTSRAIKLVVIIGLLVLGLSFLTSGEGFVMAALVGALAVWTVQGRVDAKPTDPNPTSASRIVAIGDSYMSGEGSLRFFPGTNIARGNECRQSSTAFAYLLADKLDKGLDFYACSGAQAKNVWDVAQVSATKRGSDIGKKPQLGNVDTAAVGNSPALILVSIGGNDAFFGDLGLGCALPGTCDELNSVFFGRLHDVRANVSNALNKVAETFPKSPIVVVPYPDMFGTGSCDGLPLEGTEVTYLRSFIMELNQTLVAAVSDSNGRLAEAQIAYLVAGETAYQGHQLCDPNRAGPDPFNTIVRHPTEGLTLADRFYPRNWLHGTFHPTPFGHQLIATELERWWLARSSGTVSNPPAVEPVVASTSVSECPDDASLCRREVGTWMVAQTTQALRKVLLPGVLLLAVGWMLGVALPGGDGSYDWLRKLKAVLADLR